MLGRVFRKWYSIWFAGELVFRSVSAYGWVRGEIATLPTGDYLLHLRERDPQWLNREGVYFGRGNGLYINQELWPLEDRLLSSEARAYVRSWVDQEVDVAEVQVEALEETGEDAPMGVLTI